MTRATRFRQHDPSSTATNNAPRAAASPKRDSDRDARDAIRSAAEVGAKVLAGPARRRGAPTHDGLLLLGCDHRRRSYRGACDVLAGSQPERFDRRESGARMLRRSLPVILIVAVAGCGAVPPGGTAGAARAVVIGLGDQSPGMFSEPRFSKLGVTTARAVVSGTSSRTHPTGPIWPRSGDGCARPRTRTSPR